MISEQYEQVTIGEGCLFVYKKNKREELLFNQALNYLWNDVVFESATVETVVKILDSNPYLWAVILGNKNVVSLVDNYHSTDKSDRPLVDSLIVKWDCCQVNHKENFDLKPIIVGIKEEYDQEYSISLSSLGGLLGLKIKSNLRIECIEYKPSGSEKVLLGNKQIKLVEFLYAFVEELGCYGNDNNKESVKKELEKRIKSANEGSSKIISFEELKENLKAKFETNDENDLA